MIGEADAAVERLLGLAPFERSGMRPGLDRIHALLDRLGHPESGLRILHVGGTNGKGSVCALAEAVLRAAGWRTGLYTSPHLLDVAERIQIDGAPIRRPELGRQAAALGSSLDGAATTFFEAMTAAAFGAFRDAGVDVAVMEVGLGGRWDATNVGAPVASTITRVDYDHQEYLGHRLEEIAAEKAAIIRNPRGIALSAAQAPEAMGVVETRCHALGVPLLTVGREIRFEVVRSDVAGHRLHVAGPDWELRDLEVALAGAYQPANAALALAAVRALAAETGRSVPDDAVRAGCAAVRWPGRFQVIPGRRGRPTVVLDGAHNPGGATALAASLARHFPGARLTLVVGISADKDRAGILKALVPLARRCVLTAAAHPRATSPAELSAALGPSEAEVVLAPDAASALSRALDDPDADVVCVAGSLFLVADALRWLQSHGVLPTPVS
jgi:dihydrofolate synthase / folylpolyglutamate synthase